MDTNVSQTSAATAANASNTRKPTKELDKYAFLQLLVAQLKNQDPNQSQDTNQMVQQMTSFASLEQMQSTNKLLQGIQVQNIGLFQAQSASMVGKQVRVAASECQLTQGKASIGVELPEDAKVSLTIKNAQGQTVRVLDQGAMQKGSKVVTWDGLDAKGNKLPDGSYTVELNALDAKGESVKGTTTAFARVESVIFGEEGEIFLLAGGKRFSLSDVTEISA